LLALLGAGGALWYVAGRSPQPAAGALKESGTASLKLAWDKSPSDQVVGYRVVYGTKPGRYDGSMDVGNALTATVTGLHSGTRYFIAVLALDAQGNQSPPSNEVDAIAR